MRVKSVELQGLQALHRTRSLWMATRTSRINALRAFCRNLGRISKRGDRYLRMLLTHGARSVLRAASVATTACTGE